ncbi:hypothetical protein Ciccas_005998, partial [Cichlidogyrus casuarinus]
EISGENVIRENMELQEREARRRRMEEIMSKLKKSDSDCEIRLSVSSPGLDNRPPLPPRSEETKQIALLHIAEDTKKSLQHLDEILNAHAACDSNRSESPKSAKLENYSETSSPGSNNTGSFNREILEKMLASGRLDGKSRAAAILKNKMAGKSLTAGFSGTSGISAEHKVTTSTGLFALATF